MRNTSFIILIFSIVITTLVGCNLSSSSTKEQESAEPTVEEEVELEEEKVDEEKIEEETVEEEIEEEVKQEDAMNLGDYEVYIGGEVVEKEGQIIINGESNLIPGARVIGEVVVGDYEKREFYSDTSETVKDDGTFYMELAHHDMNRETYVIVTFHFDGQQDDHIKRHYGDRGQNLEGPYIYKHQGEVGGGNRQNIFKQAKVITTFEPSGEKAIRQFKEPNWHPIPEDMGSTRVWIEVDEINNDDEYYYIQGRSNLIEGSNIFVHYGRLFQDETRILPDGSFYLKVPYEYKEDTNFVIEFNPNHWSQWNEVEENY